MLLPLLLVLLQPRLSHAPNPDVVRALFGRFRMSPLSPVDLPSHAAGGQAWTPAWVS